MVVQVSDREDYETGTHRSVSSLELKAERLGFAAVGGGLGAAFVEVGVSFGMVAANAVMLFLISAFAMVYAVKYR